MLLHDYRLSRLEISGHRWDDGDCKTSLSLGLERLRRLYVHRSFRDFPLTRISELRSVLSDGPLQSRGLPI